MIRRIITINEEKCSAPGSMDPGAYLCCEGAKPSKSGVFKEKII